MTKVVVEESVNKRTFSSLSKGDFFKYGAADMLFIKTNTIRDVKETETNWNAVCIDPNGTIGWHGSFLAEDSILHVTEVTIKT